MRFELLLHMDMTVPRTTVVGFRLGRVQINRVHWQVLHIVVTSPATSSTHIVVLGELDTQAGAQY